MKEKILVAMSGGVDSSVTALLLQNQGYEVHGLHMKLWKPDFLKNKDQENQDRLNETARILGIELVYASLEQRFLDQVVVPFEKTYASGQTPNPCVECNRFLKFGEVLRIAKEMGIQKIATGHYARIHSLPNGRRAIMNGKDATKNQSYYLYGLTQEALAATLFPLGDYSKPEVREIAHKAGLPAAHTSESQEICFIPDDDYRRFLKERENQFTPGRFIGPGGKVLGQHDGRENFTIGQRKGLGIAWEEPLYVLRLEENGDVVVGPRSDTGVGSFLIGSFHGQAIDPANLKLNQKIPCLVQIRYRGKPTPARMTPLGQGLARVDLEDPLDSPAPGQSAVFFQEIQGTDGIFVLGGGIIQKE